MCVYHAHMRCVLYGVVFICSMLCMHVNICSGFLRKCLMAYIYVNLCVYVIRCMAYENM